MQAAKSQIMEVESNLYDPQRLQRHIKILLNEARLNEDKMRRLQELELHLLGTACLSDLIIMLLDYYRQAFNHDAVSLILIDPAHELQRILEAESQDDVLKQPNLIFRDDNQLDLAFAEPPVPQLGNYSSKLHAGLFASRHQLRSMAMLPLIRSGKVIGQLCLGSVDPSRFQQSNGIDLLSRLAAIISICIENSVNMERLKRTGLTDPLTSLNNRRYFDQRIIEELERASRSEQSVSCLYIDIDHFKQINDQHGHPVGDRVLKEVAHLLNKQMRRSDVLARYGGEEFAILLTNSSLPDANEIAERVRLTIQQHLTIERSLQINVSVSIGMACVKPTNEQHSLQHIADTLISRADAALLQAKQKGRNQVCF